MNRIAAGMRRQSLRLALATLLIAGLALMGSDGPHFPWPNLSGWGCLIIFAGIIRRNHGR